MDILFFVTNRLRFITAFYSDATKSFIETKRKIEAAEEPYVDISDPEDHDGPAFIEEWQHAEECIASLGRWSVLMLNTALKGYLEEFVKDMSRWYGRDFVAFVDYEKTLSSDKRPVGWLNKYQKLFLEVYRIDWKTGPAFLGELEHLILTRNDLEHNVSLISTYIAQTSAHRKRYPDGTFSDKESRFWDDSSTDISVNSEKLGRAIKNVEEFCRWLDGIREGYLNHLKTMVDNQAKT